MERTMQKSLGSLILTAAVSALLAVGCGGPTPGPDAGTGGGGATVGGGGGSTGGGGGASMGGGGGSTGGGGGATGGGGGSTGGGGGSTGGGGGSTGGGGGSTGGGGGSTGGGGGSTGGGGGSTGGGGGSTGDGGTTLDAGVTLPDGGMLNPPTVPLTFAANCGAVTACAGNEVGEWYYSAGCIDDSAFTAIQNIGTSLGCTGSVSNKRGFVAGAIGFNGTALARTVATEISFMLTLTGTVCTAGCSSVPGYFQPGTTGSCAVVNSECVCSITTRINDTGSQGYTYNAGVLTLANSGETYDTCITGSQFDYRETTMPNREPGKFSLTKY
jgi:hypothetical protein